MAEVKTKQTEASVEDFLNTTADEKTRKDCEKISALMAKATGEKAKNVGREHRRFRAAAREIRSGARS